MAASVYSQSCLDGPKWAMHASCYISRPKVKKNFDAHFIFIRIKRLKKVHSLKLFHFSRVQTCPKPLVSRNINEEDEKDLT